MTSLHGTRATCCAPHWNDFHKHWTRSTNLFLTTFLCCWYVTSRCDLDLWPLDLQRFSVLAVEWSSSVLNNSEIEQSAMGLLQLKCDCLGVVRHYGYDTNLSQFWCIWNNVYKYPDWAFKPYQFGTANAPVCLYCYTQNCLMMPSLIVSRHSCQSKLSAQSVKWANMRFL